MTSAVGNGGPAMPAPPVEADAALGRTARWHENPAPLREKQHQADDASGGLSDVSIPRATSKRRSEAVEGEFGTGSKTGRTGLIADHDASLRSCPDLTCEVVGHLPILTNVRVGTMATVSGRDDKQSRWVFVDAGDRAGVRNGWLVEERIGYADRFERIEEWQAMDFAYCIGDYCPDFRFTATGRFRLKFPACFDGLCAEPNGEAKCPSEADVRPEEDDLTYCVSKGNVFRAGDVIRMGGPESSEYLYFDRRGQLCADEHTCRSTSHGR